MYVALYVNGNVWEKRCAAGPKGTLEATAVKLIYDYRDEHPRENPYEKLEIKIISDGGEVTPLDLDVLNNRH